MVKRIVWGLLFFIIFSINIYGQIGGRRPVVKNVQFHSVLTGTDHLEAGQSNNLADMGYVFDNVLLQMSINNQNIIEQIILDFSVRHIPYQININRIRGNNANYITKDFARYEPGSAISLPIRVYPQGQQCKILKTDVDNVIQIQLFAYDEDFESWRIDYYFNIIAPGLYFEKGILKLRM